MGYNKWQINISLDNGLDQMGVIQECYDIIFKSTIECHTKK